MNLGPPHICTHACCTSDADDADDYDDRTKTVVMTMTIVVMTMTVVMMTTTMTVMTMMTGSYPSLPVPKLAAALVPVYAPQVL